MSDRTAPRSAVRSAVRRAIDDGGAPAPYAVNFATLSAEAMSTRFGWSRTGAATMIDSGQLVKYGAHNLALQSETFSPSWAGNTSTLVGTLLTSTGTSEASRNQSVSAFQTGERVSFTVRASAGTVGAHLYLRNIAINDTTPNGVAVFDLGSGAVLYAGSAFSEVTITAAGSGLYDCKCVGVKAGATAANRIDGGITTAATGALSCTVGSQINIHRASLQFDQGGEHVPTTTAARFLLRAPDYTHSVAGLLLEGARTQLLQSGNIGATLATQTKTVTAAAHTLSFFGTGSIVLTGMHSATVTGTGASVLTKLTFTPLAGSLILTVSGAVTNGMLELGSYATSRIPNPTTGTMTRAADAADIGPGAEFNALFPAAAGTLMVEWVDTGATDGDIIALHSNGTTNELISLYYSGASILTLCRAGSANQLAATVGTRIANALNKAAISWGPAGLSAVLNGGTVQANASATLPAPTHARFAGTALASSAQGARKLTATRTRTTQLTGAALQALTV